MSFRPAAFAGRPLPDLLHELARLGPGALSAADVRLHEARTPLPAVNGDTRLPADHPNIEIPGVVLEQYIGGGGQGCVFAARVLSSGKRIAVKLLSHGRAVREALLAGRVRHPNVLRVLRAQAAGSYWVVLMEFVQGTELNAGRIGSLRGCFIRLAGALSAVAAARLVHRDVKPANVLLRTPDADPVLVDFGLAVDLGTHDEEDAEVSGTPIFLPPEAWRDARPEPSWDAYALGITAAIVLGAKLPPHDAVGTVRTQKLSGEFDRTVINQVSRTEDRALAGWACELLNPKIDCRIAALRNAADDLAI